MGNGMMKVGVLDFGLGVVDVCDVVDVYLCVVFLLNVNGCYIVLVYDMSLLVMVVMLLE